jgi:NADPH-dependent curcumin reductase
MTINRQFRLAARPVGLPKRTDWNYVEASVRQPGDGEVLVRSLYLSLDPAMRGWMNEGRSYVPPVQIGEVMRAGGVGRVVASRASAFAEGDHVYGTLGVQEYATLRAADLTKVDASIAPLPVFLGTLGMSGMTAYFGLLDVGKARHGETVVVSGAAGSVGATVGQIAKIKGCRTIGIAGGSEKCEYLTAELGYDAAIDYKAEADLDGALARHCADGVDAFFDNTSGAVHDAVLRRINLGARIAICGTASYASWDPWNEGPRPERHLLVKRAIMQGFLTTDFAPRYEEAIAALAGWIREGKLRYREDIQQGIEAAPASIAMLYAGENRGKLIIKL